MTWIANSRFYACKDRRIHKRMAILRKWGILVNFPLFSRKSTPNSVKYPLFAKRGQYRPIFGSVFLADSDFLRIAGRSALRLPSGDF